MLPARGKLSVYKHIGKLFDYYGQQIWLIYKCLYIDRQFASNTV